MNNNSMFNLDTETSGYNSNSNLIIAGAVASVLSTIIVFAVIVNRRKIKVDTNDENIKETKDKTDTIRLDSHSSLNKRDNSIFDKSYEDAQGYMVPTTNNKKARYNEPIQDNEDSYYEVGETFDSNNTIYDLSNTINTTYNNVLYNMASNEPISTEPQYSIVS